jgi:undecaprenyl diphosphate synthase
MSLLLKEMETSLSDVSEETEECANFPRHIAIIMDGNQRWAQKCGLSVQRGHQEGAENLRRLLDHYVDSRIEALSLFAFSSENWSRPHQEVKSLWGLFSFYLSRELDSLVEKNIQLRFIGDRDGLQTKIREQMCEAEERTFKNDGKTLVVGINYGGRWDIVNAARKIGAEVAAGRCQTKDIDETCLKEHMSTALLDYPDLCIRTGGEQRISNFMLWQMAYTEFYFTDVLWPDFGVPELELALQDYSNRVRRYGQRVNHQNP